MSAARLDRWTQVSSGLPIGLVLGAAIWVLSGVLTGRTEPWDARGMYYASALIGSGALGGFLVPGHWAEVAIGIFAGQAVVMVARVLAEPASGGLWPLGILLLALYTLLALVGALLGSALRRLVGKAA
ncbi:MAG: hypothetical protein ACREM9_04340 [Gemmatimonadales bacterium]